MRILYSLLSSFPLSFLYSISSFTSTVISTFYRKNVVLHNLNKSFPNEDDKKIIKIKNRFYQNFCDVFFETIKSYSIGKKELGSRVFFENFDVINNHILKNEKEDLLQKVSFHIGIIARHIQINFKSSN